VISDAESGEFPVCAVVPVIELGSRRIFFAVVGVLVRGLGVSGCRIRRHHQNGEGGASRTGSEPQKGGGLYRIAWKEGKKEKKLCTAAD
jgi:hypothetical protein